MSIKAMKLALECMESAIKSGDWVVDGACDPDIVFVALRQAIEQAQKQERNFCPRCGKRLGKNDWDVHTCTPPVEQAQKPEGSQEPVAMVMPVATVISETGDESVTMSWWHEPALPVGTELYTSPPQRQWVGLNWDDLPEIYVGDVAFTHGVKWAEARLKEKNGIKGEA